MTKMKLTVSYRLICLAAAMTAVFLGIAGCGKPAASQTDGKIVVFVTIPPMREAVAEIGGDGVDVQVLVPPGMSPETYSPDVPKIMALRRASLFFAIGVPCEQAFLPKLNGMFPDLKIVKAQENMKLRAIGGGPWNGHDENEVDDHEGEHDHHEADNGHHHHHFGADPHVWLDIDNMIGFADCVAEHLTAIQPGKADEFAARAKIYKEKLYTLKQKLQAEMTPLDGTTLLVFHPAFGYFLDMFKIRQLAIEQDGKEATGAHLASVLAAAREKKCAALYIQPQQNTRTAQLVANELKDGYIIVLDPLFQDYCQGMQRLADGILGQRP